MCGSYTCCGSAVPSGRRLLHHRVEPRVPRQVETLAAADDAGVLAVVVGPQPLAGLRVEREGPLSQRRDVDDAVDDRRGAGDLRAGVELPDLLARRRVERVEVLVVGTDQDELSPDRRRCVDVAAGPM